MEIFAAAMSKHITHDPSHAHLLGFSDDPSCFCLFTLYPLSQGIHLARTELRHLLRTRKEMLNLFLGSKEPQQRKQPSQTWHQTLNKRQLSWH